MNNKPLFHPPKNKKITQIEITSISGGFTLLSVTDDGTGMFPDDLPLAATRFATSKLRTYDDLRNVERLDFVAKL